jgi:hypothetical protein
MYCKPKPSDYKPLQEQIEADNAEAYQKLCSQVPTSMAEITKAISDHLRITAREWFITPKDGPWVCGIRMEDAKNPVTVILGVPVYETDFHYPGKRYLDRIADRMIWIMFRQQQEELAVLRADGDSVFCTTKESIDHGGAQAIPDGIKDLVRVYLGYGDWGKDFLLCLTPKIRALVLAAAKWHGGGPKEKPGGRTVGQMARDELDAMVMSELERESRARIEARIHEMLRDLPWTIGPVVGDISEHLRELQRQNPGFTKDSVEQRLGYIGSVLDMLNVRINRVDPIPVLPAPEGHDEWCRLIDEIKNYVVRHKGEPKSLWLGSYRSSKIRAYLTSQGLLARTQQLLGYVTHWDADKNNIT